MGDKARIRTPVMDRRIAVQRRNYIQEQQLIGLPIGNLTPMMGSKEKVSRGVFPFPSTIIILSLVMIFLLHGDPYCDRL